MHVSAHGRVPRARIDPILTAQQALAVFGLAMSYPLVPETLVLFLDSGRCGHELVSVSGTDDPFHVVDVAETMALSACASTDIAGLVIATVRPGDGGGLLPGDDQLWFEAADVVEEFGLTLIDWLVIGSGCAQSPRQVLGIPSRWTE
ncbi:unannotated protein [freshwater metagenome]|uniref:Unannotated protein n=1 Tax=freshwater metagenome TaxID=449393 RepID=A0A6J7DXU7_9ZZZZ